MSGLSEPRKVRGVRRVSTVAFNTLEVNLSLADALKRFGAKVLARKVGASPRTTENWLAGENGPTWKHTVAMLNDDELCARLLEAAGRMDLARTADVIAAKKMLAAALKAEGK